ncbi:MAG: hypothetical protein GY765_32205 [bacterium]|nr:hypothetical protein [bacterium]
MINYLRLGLLCLLIAGLFFGCASDTGVDPSPNPDPGPDDTLDTVTVTSVQRNVAVTTVQSKNSFNRFNYSHSDTWAAHAGNNVIGTVIVEEPAGTRHNPQQVEPPVSGNLVYKTISPDGTIQQETVASGQSAEISVLVYDSVFRPHIFSVCPDGDSHQIFLYTPNGDGGWNSQSVAQFQDEGYVYEITAQRGPGDSMHLLVLNIGRPSSDPDYAHKNSRLFYVTDKSGLWQKEKILTLDTQYLYDEYVLATKRQDMVIDSAGNAHVAYNERNGDVNSSLYYASNGSGEWQSELVVKPSDTSCDAAWDPSIAMTADNRPLIVSTFVERVPTGSAEYAELRYTERLADGHWDGWILMKEADGYMGNDGGKYTGALPQVLVDGNGHVHIVYSDIASSHEGNNFFHIGQLRYLLYNGSNWEGTTLYRQESTKDKDRRNEMHGFSAVLINGTVQIIGQEYLYDEVTPVYNLLQIRVE